MFSQPSTEGHSQSTLPISLLALLHPEHYTTSQSHSLHCGSRMVVQLELVVGGQLNRHAAGCPFDVDVPGECGKRASASCSFDAPCPRRMALRPQRLAFSRLAVCVLAGIVPDPDPDDSIDHAVQHFLICPRARNSSLCERAGVPLSFYVLIDLGGAGSQQPTHRPNPASIAEPMGCCPRPATWWHEPAVQPH